MAIRVAGAFEAGALAEACNLKLDNLVSFQICADAKGIEIHAKYLLPMQKLEEVKTVLRGCQDD